MLLERTCTITGHSSPRCWANGGACTDVGQAFQPDVGLESPTYLISSRREKSFRNRRLGWLLHFVAVLAIVIPGSIARAQDEDAPEENQNAQAAVKMRGVMVQPTANVEQVDQWIFGRFGGSGGARTKLDSSLKLRIEDLNRSCHISDLQKKKLLLAGRGDVKRFFDKIEEVKRKFQNGQNDPNANIWQDIQPLQIELNTGLFGDDSIYKKTISKTLDGDQISQYECLQRERRMVRYKATIEWFVVHLDKGLGFTDDQRQRLVELLVNESRPPKKFGQGDYWYLMLQSSLVPEAKLKPIFDVPQWRLFSRQFAQARGMERWLKSNGVIPDNEKENEGVQAATTRRLPLAPVPVHVETKKAAGPK
jgi:hypothetical protein